MTSSIHPSCPLAKFTRARRRAAAASALASFSLALYSAACELLSALQELLHCNGDGPPREWRQRQAAPVREAYAMAGVRVDTGKRVSFLPSRK